MTPYWSNGITSLYLADARDFPLEDQSVHCCVTSPPYLGLRRYKGDDDRSIGLEASFEEYMGNLRQVFREVARVLRIDGVLFVNVGDAYCNETGDKLGIPERLVTTLQEDGWVWRDTFIWVKPSPMPSSVHGTRWVRHRVKVSGGRRGLEPWRQSTNPERPQQDHAGREFRSSAEWTDCPGCPKCEATGGYVLSRGSWRSTTAHEYIYMLTRGMGYYADGEPVRTPLKNSSEARSQRSRSSWPERDSTQPPQTQDPAQSAPQAGANRRSVWDDIRPERNPSGHYAVFPSGLPRDCIQIATSEAGVCPECGAQWARVVERSPSTMNVRVRDAKGGILTEKSGFDRSATGEEIESYGPETEASTRTVGWRPTCRCDAGDPIPATVLDPFSGSGTTCLAAQRLGRRSVGVELSEDYLERAVARLNTASLPMGGVHV